MGDGTKAELEAAGVAAGRGEYGLALRILLEGPAAPSARRNGLDAGGRWCRHFCPECWMPWSHGRAPERCPEPASKSRTLVCGECRDFKERIYVEGLQ